MALVQTSTTNEIIDLGMGRKQSLTYLTNDAVGGQTSQISKQISLLHDEEVLEVVKADGLIPEGTDVDTKDLRRADHTSQRPHQSTITNGRIKRILFEHIHSHQLLLVDGIGLVQNNADLIIVALRIEQRKQQIPSKPQWLPSSHQKYPACGHRTIREYDRTCWRTR